jgi:hypothetical protein
MYFMWGIGLLSFIIKIVYYLLHWNQKSERFWRALVKGGASLSTIYLFFMIGWGGNYYKQSLEEFWHLDKTGWNDSELVKFDKYLVGQLNATAPHYYDGGFRSVKVKAVQLYKNEADCANNGKGLYIKPSVFGNMLQYMGVTGYYNPFTGEGQVNKNELPFMLPYVISHELAHQSGVGAEDDANLLAYVVAVNSNDTAFMYSAYFNLWLYTHMQLKMRDSVCANVIKQELNSISLNHLKELKEQRRKYRSKFSGYTGDMYNQYLKLNHQKDGIESYDKVTVSAWAWGRKHLYHRNSKIFIP